MIGFILLCYSAKFHKPLGKDAEKEEGSGRSDKYKIEKKSSNVSKKDDIKAFATKGDFKPEKDSKSLAEKKKELDKYLASEKMDGSEGLPPPMF